MAKKVLSKKKTVKKVAKPGVDISLPLQRVEDIQLLNTDTKVLLDMSATNPDLRETLEQLKKDFISKVQDLVSDCEVKADIRVYFTFTQQK